MKILFLTNAFSFPNQPGMPRPFKIAQYLVRHGHQVTVITNQRHYIDEKIRVADDNKNFEFLGGIRIIGVETTHGRRKSLGRRLLNYVSFSVAAFQAGIKLEKYDIVLTGTPPPLAVPLAGLALAKKHKAFSILEIRDLYPETAVALGQLRNRWLIRFWRFWEQYLRMRFDHVVGVVPGIRDKLIKRNFPANRVTTITNGYDWESEKSFYLPVALEKSLPKAPPNFLVLYGGSMGYASNLLPVLQAAESLRDENIKFAFFGKGEKRIFYEDYVRKKGLENCLFFSPQPRNVISEVYKRSSALIHSYIDSEFFAYALPNKIFDYHGAGKPIVFAGMGDTADLIRTAGSGIVVNPEDPERLAQAIKFLSVNPSEAKKMGESGKKYITEHYNRERVFSHWNKLISIAERKAQHKSMH